MTSCGLNGGLLRCEGSYEAGIACVLIGTDGACKTTLRKNKKRLHPYITQKGKDRESDPKQYIANVLNGTVIGYKYFEILHTDNSIALTIRGHKFCHARGRILISTSLDFAEVHGTLDVNVGMWETRVTGKLHLPLGKQALYLKFRGTGALDIIDLTWN